MHIRTAAIAAIAVASLVAFQAEAAPTACPANFLGGQAPDLTDARMANKAVPLCYSEFGVLYSGLTRTPLWSADHLTAARVEQASHQRRDEADDTFHEEDRLPANDRAWLRDYVRSGYDRGHMSPNGDMDNAAAQGESFTLANMVPQNPDNNRNLWEGVEEATRDMARTYGEVWVVTVPIFAGAQTQFLHDHIAIPARIAKAVYVPSTGVAAAYLTNNAPGMDWQAISIAQLRQISGIDPFPALPEQVKQAPASLPAPTPHKGHRQHADAEGITSQNFAYYQGQQEGAISPESALRVARLLVH
jgi:endonuclease G